MITATTKVVFMLLRPVFSAGGHQHTTFAFMSLAILLQTSLCVFTGTLLVFELALRSAFD